jgi:threonine synthase
MTILDLVGNTPLVELKKISSGLNRVSIHAKAEFRNLSGSVKDRAAKAMLLEGIESGKLRPGKTIIDASSGNTGIAYAMLGAVMGYPVTIFLPANASRERKTILACPKVIAIPHLGASTPEAEDNCAVMAVQQLMDYLESGAVKNSVNLPRCRLDQRSANRLIVVNRNIPNMVGQITTILAAAAINIGDLINHHRDDYAYNIIDTEQEIPEETLKQINEVEGIIRVRALK